MTKSFKELLEEEENRQAAESTAAVNSLVQQSNKAEIKRVETPTISGVVLPDSVRDKITQYKRDQEDFDTMTNGTSTVDDFLKFYNNSGYEEFAMDYAFSNGMSIEDFHNTPTDKSYWKNLYKEEDKKTLENENSSFIGNQIDTKFNFTANNIVPKLTKIPELHDRNMLGFTDKTIAKGTGFASMYGQDETAYRLIVEKKLRDRLPDDIAANFSVVPIEQLNMESLGAGGDLDKNFAIVNKATGEYELLNNKGMFDNFTSFTASLATPEMGINLAGDAAIFSATRNPYVIAGGLAVSAAAGYSIIGKDIYSNPRRLEGTGYDDPDPIKEGDAIVMGVLSPLIGMWGFGVRGASNKVRTSLNLQTSDELKSAISYLDELGIDPKEVLTAGNFAAFLKTLENQSKNLTGTTGAVSKKEKERVEIFTEVFSRIVGAESSNLDDILKVVDGNMLRDIYTTSDSLILTTTESRLGVTTGGNKNISVGENLLKLFETTQATYKNIKGTMFDEAENGINTLIRNAESNDYKVFYQIPDDLHNDIAQILTGLQVPQATSKTVVRDVEAAVIDGADNVGSGVPIAEGQPFRVNQVSKESVTPTTAQGFETVSGNLPPINFSNIPPEIASKFKAILGFELNANGQIIMKGGGVSVNPNKPMVRGIFGVEGNTAFDTLRGLERQITKALHDQQNTALKNGSSTATYKDNAKDLINLRNLIHDIMDVDNLKRVKTNTDGNINLEKFEGNIFPIGQSNDKNYQTIKSALEEVKSFTAYQEKVFNTTNFKQLAAQSFMNELPSKILQKEINNVSVLDDYVHNLFAQVDTISTDSLKNYFPNGQIPKNIQKMIDNGMKTRTAIKHDFKESFTASMLEMPDAELTKFLDAANRNKRVLTTMFGDEADSVYTNLRLYNNSMTELAKQQKIAYQGDKEVKAFIKERLNANPKEMAEFLTNFNITGKNKELFEKSYLNNLMTKAFTNKGKDGTMVLDLKVAVAEMDNIMKNYAKDGSPLKEIFDEKTMTNLFNFRTLIDTIAVHGGDMGSSLVTSAIAANAGKISKPSVMARAFWEIFKYQKIGQFLTGETIVKRLLTDVKPKPNVVTAKNIAASEASSTMWQITQNATNDPNHADYDELLNIFETSGYGYYGGYQYSYGR